MPLLTYLLQTAGRPGDDAILSKFRLLADKADPSLKDPGNPMYAAARQLVAKLGSIGAGSETPEQKKAAHVMLAAVRNAVKTEDAADDIEVIREHGMRLAELHGVAVPPSVASRLGAGDGFTVGGAKGRPSPKTLSDKLKAGSKLTKGDDDEETDDVPVRLTKGEFVVDKDSTDKYEPLLRKINAEEPRRGGMSVGGFGRR